MELLIVGSIAIDSIQTPWGHVEGVLGGSATYAALAARLWTQAKIVGVVGSDFPQNYRNLFKKYNIDGAGFVQKEGKTFRWKGRYNEDLQPTTLFLDLGVFSQFQPKLPKSLTTTKHAFLGNIHPSLQEQVLQQLSNPRITACDSREDWIRTQRKEFLRILKKVDVVFLNDSETRLLTQTHNLVQATRVLARLGPKVAIVKKGEHGVLAATRDSFYSLPSNPVGNVVDPTGAGDAFAGACLGYLTTQRRITWTVLRRALQYATTTASLTIEAFGPSRLFKLTAAEIVRKTKNSQTIVQTPIL